MWNEKKYFKISILYSEKIEIRITREREEKREKREKDREGEIIATPLRADVYRNMRFNGAGVGTGAHTAFKPGEEGLKKK